jgi:N-acetylneuraminate synthase
MSKRRIPIGNTEIGDGCPCYIIAEVGINHNGSVDTAKQLIDVALECGCNVVKFQKRTIEVVYTSEELAKPRDNPFGSTTGDLKRGLEFGYEQYAEIDSYCKKRGIGWFASCWDEESVDFVEQFDPPCFKIASACLNDEKLLRYHCKYKRPIILSTGMSDMPLIQWAVDILSENPLAILHCTSTYPSRLEDLNLRGILTLKDTFPSIPIGYSGHEVGLSTTVASTVLGASIIERHITLDRSMWGSDQAASIEPQGLKILCRDIRAIETAMGDGVIKVYESEKPILEKLRRIKSVVGL